MANDKNFVIKNGLQAGRYLQTGGTDGAGSEVYSLANASYDSKSFSVSSQSVNDSDLAFNNDGTKMYMVAFDNTNNSDAVYQYSLSTAYDVSTASYDSVSHTVGAQATTAVSVVFNSDGTKMYVGDFGTDVIFQYSLSTAYDISTSSYDSVSYNTNSQDTSLRDFHFNSSGTKLYTIGSTTDSVYQHTLTTGFDISTASYDSVSFDVSTEVANPFSVVITSDGTKMFVSGSSLIQQYDLSTAFDLSTASASSTSYTDGNVGPSVRGLLFNGTGEKMYFLDSETVYQYSTVAYTQTLDLSTGTYFSFTPSGDTTVTFANAPASGKAVGFAVEINGDGSAITWPTSVKWHGGVTPTPTSTKDIYVFITIDGGTTYLGRRTAENLS